MSEKDDLGYSIDGVPSIKLGVHETGMNQLGETKKYTPIYCKCHSRIDMRKKTNEFGESTISFVCSRCGVIAYVYCWDYP